MRKWTNRIALLLAFALPAMPMAPAVAQGVSLQSKISVPGGEDKLTIRLRDTSLREALQLIAEQKRLNLTLDDSISSEKSAGLNLDFFNTPLNNILETLISSNGLEMQRIGSTYVVYRSGRYGRPVIRFIPLSYANAANTAAMVTSVLAESAGTSSTEGSKLFATQVRPDTNSNALIVSGQDANVQLVEQLVKRMDVLLPNRVFTLSYVTVPEAIDVLKASFFKGSQTSGAAGGTSSSGSSVKTTFRDFGGTAPGALPLSKTETISVSEQTPRFIPLGNQNAILAVGSQAELSMAEQVLKALDRKPPQVLIRTQIVEINQGALQNLGMSYGLGSRQFTGGFDQNSVDNNGRFKFESMTNQAANLKVTLDALLQQNKAKMLASPSVLAMDNRSSVIRIGEEIVSSMTTKIVTPDRGPSYVTTEVQKDFTGITLELTPRIDPHGNVTMAVHPIISARDREERDAQNDIVATLKKTREYQTQEIRVRNGETIIIAGLIQDSGRNTIEKIPFLGDLPFIGGLFRRTIDDNNRTEIQIFITPEIINDADA